MSCMAWTCAGLAVGIVASALTAAEPPAVTVGVDPRVEMMSIIFRLAGNPEYSRCMLPDYAADIDKHFADQCDHPVVKLAQQLRAKRGVSFDAVMSMAVHLDTTNGVKAAVPLDPRPTSLDARWTADQAGQFVELADDFARKSKFSDFASAHQAMYDDLAAQMRKTLDEGAKIEWFDEFFGKRAGATFCVVVAPANGPNCYGPHIRKDGADRIYAIMGVWKRSAWTGKPAIDPSVVHTIIHEFAHSYCNPLVDANAEALEPAGEKLFAPRQKQMRQQAYSGWRTMMYESLVRACEVRYTWDTVGSKAAGKLIDYHQQRGFAWTGDLANLLGEYEAERKTYPTMNDFMPRVIELFDDVAAQENAAKSIAR